MSFGKRIVHISGRDRWLLFSSLVDVDDPNRRIGTRKQLPAPDDNASFDHPFFKRAERMTRSKLAHTYSGQYD